jgi:O-antigen/teichoic acid export membrane protein
MTAGYFIVFVMSVVMAVCMLLARGLISDNIHVNTELKLQFQQAAVWIAVSIFPQFLTRVPHGFLLSQLRNQTVRQIELFSSISLWLGAIMIAVIEKNLTTIAVWCFFSNLLVFGIYLWVVNRLIPFRFQLDRVILHKMLHFSGYMFLETLAIALFQHFDKVIVGMTLGPALAGVYSIGTSLAQRLSMVAGQATEVMVPYASLQDSLGDQQRVYAVFRKLSHYVSIVLAGLSSFLVIWMHEILSLWIAPDFANRYTDAFRILIVAYGLLSLCRPAHQTLTGMGKIRFTALIYLVSTIFMLIGLFFLSNEFGLPGAVASNLILVLLLVFNAFLYSRFEVPLPWKHMLSDLKWGLFLPVLVYGLSLFPPNSPLTYKVFETAIVGILLVWVIAKDSLTRIRLPKASCS